MCFSFFVFSFGIRGFWGGGCGFCFIFSSLGVISRDFYDVLSFIINWDLVLKVREVVLGGRFREE